MKRFLVNIFLVGMITGIIPAILGGLILKFFGM